MIKFFSSIGYCDLMTGCKNRNYYERKLKHKYKNKSCTIMIYDINNLKQINDTYGHNRGDEVIKYVAISLLNLKNIKDVIRFGGDEFVAILPYCEDIDENFNIAQTSFGYFRKDCCTSFDEAFIKADEILYKNKRGKNE